MTSHEGGCLARALGEPIFTEAGTLDELRAAVRQAVQCQFDDIRIERADTPTHRIATPTPDAPLGAG